MRIDTIFYSLFQVFPTLLFELIGVPSNIALDIAENYEFSSREIKELSRRFDGLFIPQGESATEIIYFVEVQFQAKPDFYRRLFAEIFSYLGQYQTENNWCAVAIFSTRSLDPGLSIHYVELQPKLRVVYLDELIINQNLPISLGIVQLVVDSREEAIEKTPRLLQRVREEIADPNQWRKILDLIETVLVYKFTDLSREELETMFSLSDLKQTKVYQEAKIEGKLEGKIEGKLELLPKLLAAGLSVEQVAQILEVELDVVTSQVGQEGARE